MYGGPVAGSANIQLDVCSPNFLIQEGIQSWDGFHAEILQEPVVWENGTSLPRPGRDSGWSSTSSTRMS